jgi:hypothetical protein
MYEEYVCKIKVFCPNSTNVLEGTAFGYTENGVKKLMTAGHMVTDAIGKKYPQTNTMQLDVIFENHTGVLNLMPMPARFELNGCNDSTNYYAPSPFVDSATIYVENLTPVSKYFAGANHRTGDYVVGVGYPYGTNKIRMVGGVIRNFLPRQCLKHSCCQNYRFLVDSENSQGCSGGPYLKRIGDDIFVVGSVIGAPHGYTNTTAAQSMHNFV